VTSRRLLACFSIVAIALTAGACRTSYAFRAGELTPVKIASADHSAKDRVRIVLFGDSGSGKDSQRAVARGMAAACAGRTCDFGILVGDNIYPTGIAAPDDPQLGPKFHGPYDPLGIDVWLWPGNHDWYNKATLQPAIDHTTHASNTGGRWKMPFNYFGLPSLPSWLHIFGLDTSVMADLHKDVTPEQARALRENASLQVSAARQALCGQQGWRLLVGHHFVYSSGSRHGAKSGQLAADLEPLIRDCGVQLYLSGHDHHQELLRVETEGKTYYQVVQGAGGGHRSLRPPPQGAAQEFVRAELGFSIIEATRDRLRVAFYVCDGRGACTERHSLELRQP
jgi:hypothetical protein